MENTIKDSGYKMASEMLNFVNLFDNEEKFDDFVMTITNGHRTLQQSFTELVFKYILAQAKNKESGNYDLRNKASVEMCHKVVEFLKREDLVYNDKIYFPTI